MSNNANSTVMGPGPSGAPNKLFDPPKLLPSSDKLVWRKRVRLWAKTVRSLAKGGDSKAVGAYNAMAYTLYTSIDDTYAGKLEGAIDAGTLRIDFEDGEEQDPLKTVEDIIQLVAKDTVTDTVRREASMLKQIHSCKRKEGETATAFAHRYEGLALKYINTCDALGAKQISQSFAITLLDNANITSSVYSAIVSQMVARANERGQVSDDVIAMPKKNMDKVGSGFDKVIEEYRKLKIEKDILLPDADDPVMQRMFEAKKAISRIHKQMNHDSADRPKARITLEDAVRALSDVRVDEVKGKPQLYPDIRAIGTMLGKRSYGHRNDADNNESEKRQRYGAPPFDPAKQRCRMCKRKGHFYKDPSCIYNQIRTILNQNDAPNAKDGKDTSNQIAAVVEQFKSNSTGKEVHPQKQGSDELLSDPNPILDEGAPTSTGGISNAATLCDILGIPLHLDPPREHYYHGWGQDCLGAKLITCAWTLHVHDTRGKPTAFTFDLVEGESPLILGMNVRKYTNTFNLAKQRYIEMRRPTDTENRIFFTYLVSGDNRLRIDIAPHPLATVGTLLGNIHSAATRTPLTFCKRIHRYTHAHPDELRSICAHAGILDESLDSAITKVSAACEICAKNGRPAPSRKVSLTHVNEAFNEEIQLDFFFIKLKGTDVIVLLITDTGTGYSEMVPVESRQATVFIRELGRAWVCRHGAPKAVSADDEYHRKPTLAYLRTHDIQFKPRPARRHNKTGIVERKVGAVKSILLKMDDERTDASISTIIARAAFLSNLFSGTRILSSFELVRGYRPSIVGIPSTVISQELLDAHREQVAIRALQRLIRSRAHTLPTSAMFPPGTPVWVYYRTTKQNEKDCWLKATVVEAKEHFVLARRSQKGPPMRVAYEDIRLAPRNDLTAELLSCSLEDDLQASPHIGPTESESDASQAADLDHDDNSGNEHSLRLRIHNPVASPDIPQPAPVLDDISPKGGEEATTQNETISDKHRATLLSSNTLTKQPEPTKDIGEYAASVGTKNPNITGSLSTDRGRILSEIYGVIGSKQVTARHLDFAPPWVLEEAFHKEHDSNWADAYTTVPEDQVPRNANVISSHIVYKVKTQENGTRAMKARIVPHGNRDDEKDNIRKDSSTAQLFVIRLLLSLVTFLDFRLATADIKGAYLQSGPIQRDIYVRPPREWVKTRGILWKLLKLPYGIVEASRQWQKTVENWMIDDVGLERVIGVSQLFIKRGDTGNVILLIAKVTDDFLLGGSIIEMKKFLDQLQRRFVVGKTMIDERLHFDGCEIEQDQAGNIKMSMYRYLERLKPIDISRARRKERDEPVTPSELTQYRSLACTLMYLGNGVLPQASYVTSALQQCLPGIRVRDLIEANEMLKEVLNLNPWVVFKRVTNVDNVVITTFSDAGFNKNKSRDYGQTGMVTGLRISSEERRDVFHPIDWCSNKQRRVSYSSYGAEILACADGDDRCYYFKSAINSIFTQAKVRNELFTDSRCLYDTITTLHEGRDFRLRPTVQRLRNSFESQELNAMRWIPGNINPADGLTKRNPGTYAILNKLLSDGVINIDLESGFSLDSETWQ